MNTIGFLGTGNMGTAILKGIAGSSMKSETKLYAYNPTAAKVDALASYGVQKCSSEAEVAAASQYLFLMPSRRTLCWFPLLPALAWSTSES